MQPEGEHPLAVRMLSGCQQAVKKKNGFAQTHSVESTNQNTNFIKEVITLLAQKFLKMKPTKFFRVAVRWLPRGCRLDARRLSDKIVTILKPK